jgi:hypothetical protein
MYKKRMVESNINVDMFVNNMINILSSPYSIYNSISNHNNNNYNYNDENILNMSFVNDKNKYKLVLSEDSYEDVLKIEKYTSASAAEDTCPIMSTKFVEGQDIIRLPCNHCFEPDAIKQWLIEEKAECPVCRYNKFKTIEKKINATENETMETIENDDINDINQITETFIYYQNYTDFNTFINTMNPYIDTYEDEEEEDEEEDTYEYEDINLN